MPAENINWNSTTTATTIAITSTSTYPATASPALKKNTLVNFTDGTWPWCKYNHAHIYIEPWDEKYVE